MLRNKFTVVLSLALVLAVQAGAVLANNKKQMNFKVRIENISTGEQTNASGTKYPFALSPGMYVVSKKEMPLFQVGKKLTKSVKV